MRQSIESTVAPSRLAGISLFAICAVTAWAGPVISAASEGWPQWRGPTRDGQVSGPVWPEALDASRLQREWEVKLGPSYSGPIVQGNRVFVTETLDKREEVGSAFDRHSGGRLWQSRWAGALSVPFFAKSSGDWIRSTPACDGERLYVAGMRDVLVCLDVTDGSEIWRVDFVKDLGTPLPDFGFVCSPLVEDGSVFAQAGGGVARIEARTGRIQWRAMNDGGGMMGSAFSSPIVASLGGVRQLLVQSRSDLAGLDLATGGILWRQPVKAFRGMNILTPVVHGDILLTSTYGGRTIGYRVFRENGAFAVEEAWLHKSQGYMSTPVVVGDHAYHHLRSQRVMCLDLRSGEEAWTSPRSFGKYWSLAAQNDRILALDQKGELFLLRATPAAFDLIDSRRVSESETWAHLSVAGGQVFVRSLNALSVWRWQEPASAEAGALRGLVSPGDVAKQRP